MLRIGSTRRGPRRMGSIPYGQQLAEDGKTLLPRAHDQKRLTRIKRLHRGGLSGRRIAEKVTAEGDTRRTGAPLSKSPVARRLRG